MQSTVHFGDGLDEIARLVRSRASAQTADRTESVRLEKRGEGTENSVQHAVLYMKFKNCFRQNTSAPVCCFWSVRQPSVAWPFRERPVTVFVDSAALPHIFIPRCVSVSVCVRVCGAHRAIPKCGECRTMLILTSGRFQRTQCRVTSHIARKFKVQKDSWAFKHVDSARLFNYQLEIHRENLGLYRN